jgi:thioredoxin-related protein
MNGVYRGNGMRLIIGLFLVWVSICVQASEIRNPDDHFFDQTLGDLDENLEEAREMGKQGILIFFELDECPFCHRMKATVLNRKQVQEYYKERFLIYALDIESDSEITDFEGNATTEKAFFSQVTRNRHATPVFAFFDLDGKLVVRYTGATSGIDEFMWLGQYASEGQYKKMTFTKYKRERRKEMRGK